MKLLLLITTLLFSTGFSYCETSHFHQKLHQNSAAGTTDFVAPSFNSGSANPNEFKCRRYDQYYAWSTNPHSKPIQEDTTIYTDVEEPAQFRGGNLSMLKHLRENIIYPATEIDFPPEKCFVTFIVEKDGSLTHITMTRSSGNKAFDAEIIRVVSLMPKWIPAKSQGNIVRFQYFLPINIHLR